MTTRPQRQPLGTPPEEPVRYASQQALKPQTTSCPQQQPWELHPRDLQDICLNMLQNLRQLCAFGKNPWELCLRDLKDICLQQALRLWTATCPQQKLSPR